MAIEDENAPADLEYGAACAQIESLLDIKRFREALKLSREAILLDPGREDAYCLAACALFEVDGVDEVERLNLGIRYCEEAIACNPSREWPYRVKSIYLEKMGKHQEAILMAEQAVSASPDSSVAHFNLVKLLFFSGRLFRARWMARILPELAPNEADTFELLGLIAKRGGNFLEAERLFRKALEINPESAYVMGQLAWVLHRCGRLQEAEPLYRASLKLNPFEKNALSKFSSFQTDNQTVGVLNSFIGFSGSLLFFGTLSFPLFFLARNSMPWFISLFLLALCHSLICIGDAKEIGEGETFLDSVNKRRRVPGILGAYIFSAAFVLFLKSYPLWPSLGLGLILCFIGTLLCTLYFRFPKIPSRFRPPKNKFSAFTS